jgi:queuosine precursor transporter
MEISGQTKTRSYRYLGSITVAYITLQLVSDITAGKIIRLFAFPVSVTVLYFPVTYLFGDILTEVYGYARSRSVIWKAFFASVGAGIIYAVVVRIPPAPGFLNNDAYTTVLGSVPRILCGGWLAVWVGGILNDYILAKMKVATNGRYLWMRTVGSTVVSEFANTAIFYSIALYGVLPTDVLIQSILTGWTLKTAVEVMLTPWTYWVVSQLKEREDEDYFDKHTDFNPLIIEAE